MTPKRDEVLTIMELVEQQSASYYSPKEWQENQNMKANMKQCFGGEHAVWL